ncbi:MAG: amidohydrolase family protein [Actinomycetota bacterium]
MTALHIRGTVLPAGEMRDVFAVDGAFTFEHVERAVTVGDGGWLVPGLVDAHAHLAMASPAAGSSIDEMVRASAAAHLEAGVLAVREPGSPAGHASADLGAGFPYTVTAGRFLAPPGRYFPGLAKEVPEASLPEAATEEARSGGWVKIVADFPNDAGHIAPNWSQAALNDTAAAAHAAGARITMHATIPGSIEQAIQAGFDAIEHGHGATADHLTAMAAAGIALVPTLLIADFIRKLADEMPLQPEDRATWRREVDGHMDAVRTAAEAGVACYAGTDAGAVDHGLVAHEIALLRDAGLSGEAALAAGSWGARTWLGLPGIEEGAPADLVAFPDDPREDPDVLLRPTLIVLRGDVIRPR